MGAAHALAAALLQPGELYSRPALADHHPHLLPIRADLCRRDKQTRLAVLDDAHLLAGSGGAGPEASPVLRALLRLRWRGAVTKGRGAGLIDIAVLVHLWWCAL